MPSGASIGGVYAPDANYVRTGATDTGGTYASATLTSATFSGTTAIGAGATITSPTLVTPVIGVATGTSLALTGALASSSPSAGIGYTTGAGGTVTQSTNKSTGVTLNTLCGTITMNNASLNNVTAVGFTLTNSSIGANDRVIVNIVSGGTASAYTVTCDAVAAGSCHIMIVNVSGGALAEAVVIGFAVLKGAVS